MKKGQAFVAEKAILKESNGTERVVYVQERGSIVSTVSKAPKSSWRTEEQFATSRLREFNDEDNDMHSSSTNDSDSDSQYSTTHYNDDGECVGGVLRSE
jgi:hypothetical protein